MHVHAEENAPSSMLIWAECSRKKIEMKNKSISCLMLATKVVDKFMDWGKCCNCEAPEHLSRGLGTL